jgi:hypothetical protein
MHGINKLECYITLGQKSSPGTSTLTYLAYLKVSKKLNYCKYVPASLSNIRLGRKIIHATIATAYLVRISVMKKKVFVTMTPAYCVYKDEDYEERGKN